MMNMPTFTNFPQRQTPMPAQSVFGGGIRQMPKQALPPLQMPGLPQQAQVPQQPQMQPLHNPGFMRMPQQEQIPQQEQSPFRALRPGNTFANRAGFFGGRGAMEY